VPEVFLGDGLIYEELLPLVWTAGALAEGLVLARINADNQQLLGAEASLDDVRVHDALKDESPALVHELQRLEFKLNILLRLTAELATRSSSLPAPQRVRLASGGMEWFGEGAPAVGETGMLAVYINPAIPQALQLGCTVVGERLEALQRGAQLQFSGVSDAVVDLLEKLIFRHHRRLVAGSKLTAGGLN